LHRGAQLLAANAATTRAAAKATKTIPIIMLAEFDPVGIGVVKSLERPGTNVTGTTMYAPQLIGERLRAHRPNARQSGNGSERQQCQ
jgi:putative ABC transport system substrate-binding protein